LDTGIATNKNINWLKENQYYYIVVNRGDPLFEKNFSDMKTSQVSKLKGLVLIPFINLLQFITDILNHKYSLKHTIPLPTDVLYCDTV